MVIVIIIHVIVFVSLCDACIIIDRIIVLVMVIAVVFGIVIIRLCGR